MEPGAAKRSLCSPTVVGVDIATAFLCVLLLIAACLGLGASVLRGLKISADLSAVEKYAWGFSTGFAALGWILFFPAWAGFLSMATLLVICGAAAGLCVLYWRPEPAAESLTSNPIPGPFLVLLIAAGGFIGIVDLLEGLAPPADADSLAYHFNLPKRHLEAGELVFFPRALDGAPPQLLHMTYMAALGIGGERALTLWTMVSGWVTGFLLYAIARRWLSAGWAAGLALIYLSTPAVLQTGGTGHVEARLSQFALLGAVACGLAVNQRAPRFAALAGLCAGAYIGAKLTGLLFALACAVVLVFGRDRLRSIPLFAVVTVAVCFQWYLWVWLKSGDPLFPILYTYLGVSDPSFWNAAHHAVFEAWRPTEGTAVDPTPWGFLYFPFYITFANDSLIESGRTGLGLFALLLLPFAAAEAWRRRRSLHLGVLPAMAAIAILFGALMFFGGLPQRVRFLLPLLPVALICLSVAAVRWSGGTGAAAPLIAGSLFCLASQLGAQAVYGLSYARHFASGENRSEFIARTVSMAGMVPWMNQNLTRSDRVLVFNRQLLYLIDSPVVYTHRVFQAKYNFILERERPQALYRSLRDGGVNHLAFAGLRDGAPYDRAVWSAIDLWRAQGCLELVREQKIRRINSRTLNWANPGARTMYLYRLVSDRCSAVPSSRG